jgi:hypothetical protein
VDLRDMTRWFPAWRKAVDATQSNQCDESGSWDKFQDLVILEE